MNYGLYLSATGVLTNLHRQDVLANNLANVETVGFKADLVHLRQRAPERLESGHHVADSNRLLEQLGGGHLLDSTRINLEQGNLQPGTGPLDLAIEGPGFFVTAGPSGDAADPRLTRDGRLTRDDTGRLVTATSGAPVLDVAGRSITLDAAGSLSIRRDGTILQNETEVGRLRIVDVSDDHLVKAGGNLFRVNGPPGAMREATGAVRQGYVEASGVDPIMTLNHLIGVTKTAQANAKLMQYHDHIMGQAIGTFGRVA